MVLSQSFHTRPLAARPNRTIIRKPVLTAPVKPKTRQAITGSAHKPDHHYDSWDAHRDLLRTGAIVPCIRMITERKKFGIPDDVIASALDNPDDRIRAYVLCTDVKLSNINIERVSRDKSEIVRSVFAASTIPITTDQLIRLSFDDKPEVRLPLPMSPRQYRTSHVNFLKSHPDDLINKNLSITASYDDTDKDTAEMNESYKNILKNGPIKICRYLLSHRGALNIADEIANTALQNSNPYIRAEAFKQGVPISPEQVEKTISPKEEFIVKHPLCSRGDIPLSDEQVMSLVSTDNDQSSLALALINSSRHFSTKILEMFEQHPNKGVSMMSRLRQGKLDDDFYL